MANDEKDEKEDVMVMLQMKGLNERWAIKREEMMFEKNRFAFGAGGDLFRAKWRGLDCVAKTLAVDIADERKQRQNLVDLANEIKVLSTLRHPHLVMFLGACFQVGKAPILLIEYCPGGNLEKKLIQHTANATRMKTKEALQHTTDLAVGLNFLHLCKPPVIHRDLKPSNILLTADNRIKITDFGLSKFINKKNAKQNDKYVLTGETGSYRFMAPEVYQHKEYNEKVDVYSFAIIVYWMFTGYKPYADNPDPKASARAVATVGKRPNVEHVKHKGVHKLLSECWAQNPDDRPSFEVVVDELTKYNDQPKKKDSCTLQ
uniref:Protein kinase domain-containing protein n=1 Tax=Aplanochytrium stocchinoi TaxID=215587 RepID=A0A7S3PK62_9STRA|mmetsp:Transcript_13144/g.16379  ORF Transcript_13144/g.16379 Transcript_13144/m.16379 type:complete len:317 (+) Transcript_13144:40-990(+)